jgi:hypothetical protein
VDYLTLTEKDKRQIEFDRIRTLERAHYAALLELDECREAGVPEDSDPVQRVIKDLLAIEGALSHYRKRVAPAAEPETGDDELTEPRPVGDEAPK